MGNVQSHGQPMNRLSKPKTFSNSPSLAPSMDSPVSLSSRYVSARDRLAIKTSLQVDYGMWESALEEEEKSSEEVFAGGPGRLSCSRSNSRSNSLSCFGSKASSTTRLTSLPGSKVSLVESSHPVDLETAISILREVQRNASPEDIAMLQQVLQSHTPSPSPRPSSVFEPSLSRRTSAANRSTTSEISAPLVRRRSVLATPGVATRTSPAERRRTWNSWKTPHLSPEEQAKWAHQPRSTSLPTDSEEPAEPQMIRQSIETPGTLEYSHLGYMELGSLRIANGEPSPEVWSEAHTASHHLRDYFHRDDSPIVGKFRQMRRRHVRSKSEVQAPSPSVFRNLRSAKTASLYGTLPAPHVPERSPLPFFEDLDAEPEPVKHLRVVNKSETTISTLSTKSDSRPPTVRSVPLEDDDEGFVEDPIRPDRDDAVDLLDEPLVRDPAVFELPFPEVLPLFSRSPSPTKQQNRQRVPLKKADSGYSSGGSFKNKQRAAVKPDAVPAVSTIPAVSRNIYSAPESRQSVDSGSERPNCTRRHKVKQMLHTPASQKALPTPPAKEHVAGRALHRIRSHEDPRSSVFLNKQLPADWTVDDLDLSALLRPSKTPKTPKTPKSPTSFVSHFTIDSSTPKRLQKRRPSFQEPPVVQSRDSIPEGSIPSVPKSIRKQHVRRLSETPGMDCLTHTYPTKNHVNREEPEPVLPKLEQIKFPSPSATPEPAPRGRHHKRASTERPSSRFGFRERISLFRRKSEKGRESRQSSVQDPPSLLDFSTLAASRRSTDTDTAARQRRLSSPTRARESGNATPRTQSMVNMDAKTAAGLANLRQNRRTARPPMRSRPNSYYSERSVTEEADHYHRQSFYNRTWPMPTIPSIGSLDMVSRLHEDQAMDSSKPSSVDLQPVDTESTIETPIIEEMTPIEIKPVKAKSIESLPIKSKSVKPITVETKPIETTPTTPKTPKPTSGRFRARTVGRGSVVTSLIEKFDNPTPKTSVTAPSSPTTHYTAELQRSRAYSRGQDLVTRRFNQKVNHPDWA